MEFFHPKAGVIEYATISWSLESLKHFKSRGISDTVQALIKSEPRTR
jgi:hypothetical protein